MAVRIRMMLAIFAFLGFLAQASAEEGFSMNFQNADIRAVIEFVAKTTGKRFLIDNRVRGNVSIIASSPLSKDEVYDVFLSILEVNGYAAVPAGPVIKIVPRAEAKQKTVPVVRANRDENDALVTSVIRLKFADAQQVVAIIRPLVSPNSHVVAYPRGNMVLITDSAANIARIQQIIALLDRKEATGVRLFALKHASADKVAALLGRLYPAKTAPGGLKAIAHQPGNMLVVVASPQTLNEVAELIRKLDRMPATETGRLHVRYLKHAKAEEVAKALTSLLAARPAKGKPGIVAGEVKVVADPATNALLITADPSDMRAVDRIIDKLDIPRRQVLIEALIVEVRGNIAEQLGIEWRAAGDFTQPGRRAFGGTVFPSQTGVSINTVATNPLSASGAVIGVVNGTITFAGQTFLNL
ncbi:MAG: type II secretion system protein GspD, partial [Zetaproteobacteria bacterium]